MKTRWLMRSSNGSLWATAGLWDESAVKAWECAKPVRPLVGAEASYIPPGTVPPREPADDSAWAMPVIGMVFLGVAGLMLALGVVFWRLL